MMKAQLTREGLAVVPEESDADVYVVNTCAVTRRAENKARQYIRHLAHTRENPLILVTGCYADTSAQEVADVEGASVVFGNAGKSQLLKMLRAAQQGQRGVLKAAAKRTLDDEQIATDFERTRTFVKIQDGCDQFCAFCKTVYARGRPRDKSVDSIVREVQALADNGYREVVFTGINIAQYGEATSTRLSDVLAHVASIPELKRMRLSSINLSGVTPDLIDFFESEPKACPHFHIPLQSGDDTVLKHMNRRHTTSDFERVADELRTRIKKLTLGTDLLVGFPGETEEEFENTSCFVERIGFANVHLFRYSRRPGTVAAFFAEQVSPEVKKSRAVRLSRVVNTVARKIKENCVGERFEVLIEASQQADHRVRGYSENYFDVHLLGSNEFQRGALVPVRIQMARKDYLIGQPVTSQ
ncbi:tRNA (N(6)-L-threonylcarbamoyladenosine(37)-C(2))-methylthiotransferase MtaB [Candidatus Acetothermia bacterium]|nr:tRNA (N(6)-L-threonylcarbamoyladenosine(37)-C(2))-methylthiotransferase MtaB [Candidatus Acetothermia bacterium]